MKVEVGTYLEGDPADVEEVEFEGREIDFWEGMVDSIDSEDQFSATLRLYKCPDGYRVHKLLSPLSPGRPYEVSLYPVVGHWDTGLPSLISPRRSCRAGSQRGFLLACLVYKGIKGVQVRIVQMSDIHVGSTFVPELMDAAIEEINAYNPHLVAIPGDLTTKGYREEFEAAKTYLDRLECENVVVVPGNHDGHNVGYYHFEDLFGKRESSLTLSVPEGEAKVVALDSSEPDLDEGQVGREHYAWLDSEFRGWDRGPKILLIHHHLLDLPGTGRDRNILSDAGDVLAILRELGVELVLSGHRHVPYVNNVSNTLIVHCGTVSSTRVRGFMRPSYNRIELDGDEIRITLRYPGEGEEALASGSWRPVANIVFHPPYERYVRYDRLPV